jgi:putative ABC transport system permease protein
VQADWDSVSSGYFETLDIAVTRGRAFDARDVDGAPFVAMINQTMAERLWPGQDPIGKQLIQQVSRTEERPLQIVGVTEPTKSASISETPTNFIYVPLAQQYLSDVTFFVRRGDPNSRLAELRRAVIAFDPNLPVIHTQTLEQATTMALLPQRLAAWIAGGVGTIGLLLAALGLYGLTAFAVAQRARELALRMALGATQSSVLSLVLRQAGRLALVGTGVGLALAVGVSQLLASLLVGVGSVDAVAFGVATLLMLGVLFVATWAPARRAAAMDPMRALRAE